MSKNEIKHVLAEKLKQGNCFWSYDTSSMDDVPNDMLIEKTLIYLDIKEINLLFQIFPYKQIKRVWLDRLVPQGEYLYTLNRFLAWYYFKAKCPDHYIKSMATRHFNKVFA